MVTEDDLIFDPMCGSGTTGAVALVRNRRAILSDMEEEYLTISRSRLTDDLTGYAAKMDLAGNNPDIIKRPKREAVVMDGELPLEFDATE